MLWFLVVGFTTSHPPPERLQAYRHDCFHWQFQIFPCVFNGLCEHLIILINEIDASQLSRIVLLRFLDRLLQLFSFRWADFWHSGLNFWPQMIRSCGCSDFCKPLPGPQKSFGRLFIHNSEHRALGPRIRYINVPIIICSASLQHIWVVCVVLVTSNVPQWCWGMILPLAHRAELKFDVMTIFVIPFDRPKNRYGLLPQPWFRLLVETCPNFLEGLHWALHFWQVGPALKWIFRFHDLFQTISLGLLRLGISKFHHFSEWSLPLRWVSRPWISDASKISSSTMSATKIFPFQFSSHTVHIQGTSQVRLSYQIDRALTGHSQKQGGLQPITGPLKCSPNRLSQGVFPSPSRYWTFPRFQ